MPTSATVSAAEATAYVEVHVGFERPVSPEVSAAEAVAYTEGLVGGFQFDTYIGRVVGYMPATAADLLVNGGMAGLHSGRYYAYTDAEIYSTTVILTGTRVIEAQHAHGSGVALSIEPARFEMSDPVAVGDEAPRRVLVRAKGTQGIVLVVEVYELNTLVVQLSQTLTARWTTYRLELPSYLLRPIGNYDDLRVELSVSGQTGWSAQVSRLFFEMPAAAPTQELATEDGSPRHLEDGVSVRTLEQ